MSTAKDEQKDGHEWAERADQYREEGDLATAGDNYTTSGYAHLSEGLPTRYCSHVSWALYRLLVAGVCFRMAEEVERCQNRCKQGVLIAEDTGKRVKELDSASNAYDQARRGAWQEFIGDFRLVGDIDGANEAYDLAKDWYEHAGDPSSGLSEQEHMRLHDFFRNVALSRGHDAEEWEHVETSASLTTWVDYKTKHLPGYLTELYEEDEWRY